jgi:hypothetical protein
MKLRIVFISFILFVLIVLVLSLFGIIGPKDEGKKKQEIMNLVPIGLQIGEAQKRMESHGYKCKWFENETFSIDVGGGLQKTHPKADFLYCYKEEGSVFGLVFLSKTRWQVALVVKNGVVTEISVSQAIIAT